MTLNSLLSDILYDNMPQAFPGTRIYETFPWTNRRPILLNTHVTQDETRGLSSNTWHRPLLNKGKNSAQQIVLPHPALYTHNFQLSLSSLQTARLSKPHCTGRTSCSTININKAGRLWGQCSQIRKTGTVKADPRDKGLVFGTPHAQGSTTSAKKVTMNRDSYVEC